VSLPLTGERTVPDVPHENYWFRRHEIAYRAAAASLAGSRAARVLDAGAGEGFGAALIAESTQSAVTTLDYNEQAITHSRRRYGLHAVQGNLVAMPFSDATFDGVLSMQTIEHLWDQGQFIAECARVLRPGGILIITTPNRLTFPPGNPFHTRELDASELAELIAAAPLRIKHLRGVHHGPRLAAHPTLIDDQLGADPPDWPADLAALVGSVTTDDFSVTDTGIDTGIDRSLDLYLTAVRT
jgi:SAM-dependent methyltransferase